MTLGANSSRSPPPDGPTSADGEVTTTTPLPPPMLPSAAEKTDTTIDDCKEETCLESSCGTTYLYDVDLEEGQEQRYDNDDTNEKICRICLDGEEDGECEGGHTGSRHSSKCNNHEMIAPCLCKGSSKWVHRSCLNEWRSNQTQDHVAFSKCMECKFKYHMELYDPNKQNSNNNEHTKDQKNPSVNDTNREERRRKMRYWLYVTRDMLVVFLMMQLIITFFGWLVSIFDPSNAVPNQLGCYVPNTSEDTGTEQPLEDTTGIFGFYDDYVTSLYNNFTNNETSITYNNDAETLDLIDDANNTVDEMEDYYRMVTEADEFCYYGRYYLSGIFLFLLILGIFGSNIICLNNCSLRDAWLYGTLSIGGGGSAGGDGDGSNNTRGGVGHSNPCDACWINDCGCGSGCDLSGGDEACGCLVVILAGAAAIAVAFMVLVGAVVGFFLTVLIAQRVIRRHLFRLQKRRLALEYRVLDLSDSGIHNPTTTTGTDEITTSSNTAEYSPPSLDTIEPIPAPSAPTLPESDVLRLKRLGLLV